MQAILLGLDLSASLGKTVGDGVALEVPVVAVGLDMHETRTAAVAGPRYRLLGGVVDGKESRARRPCVAGIPKPLARSSWLPPTDQALAVDSA